MEKIITTVSTIFKERYGTTLIVQRNFSGEKRRPLFLSHWQNTFVYSRTLRQVSFPIFNSRRELQAIVTAHPVENKDAIAFDEMAQFLQLTIAEHMELTDSNNLQIETLRAVEKAHADNHKVIHLKTKKTHFPQYEFKRHKPAKEVSFRPIWINSSRENFNAHLAFSIHDSVNNWAFINAKEIPDLVWQDPNNWRNFPQVTIYVPDIETLSETKLEVLKANLMILRHMKKERPLVIVSSKSKILTPELELLKNQFKFYDANKSTSARVQAHFLLYHYKQDKPWLYNCAQTDRLYFLPLSNTPKKSN